MKPKFELSIYISEQGIGTVYHVLYMVATRGAAQAGAGATGTFCLVAPWFLHQYLTQR